MYQTRIRLRAFVLAFLFFSAFFQSMAWAGELALPELSKNATVSLVTMWPGKEIYIAWGHSAFRVRDPELKTNGRIYDEVFNYGTFDFDDPLFIPKFVYGELNYYLVHYPYRLYYDFSMKQEQREWFEQVLDLDQGQVNRIFRFLMTNSLPENKYYRYDFIKDNCSTRIRDGLTTALGSEVEFGPGNGKKPARSYRQLLDEYVVDRPLYRFAFYLVLGTESDRLVTENEATFLPHYLMRFMDTTRIVKDGEPRALVRSSATLFKPSNPPRLGNPLVDPAFVLWPGALIVLILTAFGIRSVRQGKKERGNKLSKTFDFVLFFIMGILGILVFYLSVMSEHSATKGNLNIFWMWPTHAIACFFMYGNKKPAAVRWYFLVAAAVCIVPLITWPIWPQRMIPTMIPLMLVMATRSARYFYENGAKPCI